MTTWNVTAKKWAHGWELHITAGGQEIGVTQSRTLSSSEQVVRDYIATMYDTDEVYGDIEIIPDLGGLSERTRNARRKTREAARAQEDAAREARAVARALRAEGLSIGDTASALGVSRSRVSQLVS